MRKGKFGLGAVLLVIIILTYIHNHPTEMTVENVSAKAEQTWNKREEYANKYFAFSRKVESIVSKLLSNFGWISDTETEEESGLEEVSVVRAVDGDTLVVADADGNEEKVRLIGIDTPESVNTTHPEKNNEYGEQASTYTKLILDSVEKVYLQYDTETTDTYGRTLAYVWLSDDVDTDNKDDIASKMLNAILLRDGYAMDKVYEPNEKYADTFSEIRVMAQSSGAGLWQFDEFASLWQVA